MGLASGNQGTVQVGSSHISTLSKWEAEYDQAVQTAVIAATAPWQTTVRGNKKVSGTLSGKYDPTTPIESLLAIDTLATLTLNSTSLTVWGTGQARLGKISHTCDIETGAIQEWSCPFESDGGWTIN